MTRQTKKDKGIIYAVIAAAGALVIALICILVFAGGEETAPVVSVVINEIMADNRSTIEDEDGEFSDWIELYNNGTETINLSGYYLSDSLSDSYKWAIPEITLQPGEYVIFFASGKDEYDGDTCCFHTNFRLSSDGECVVLTNPETLLESSVEFGRSVGDISFGRVMLDTGEYGYMWLESPTPKAENCTVYAQSVADFPSPKNGIIINEIMTANTYTLFDAEGDYSDWVELLNTTDSDISLDGCALSDNTDKPLRWTFPDGIVLGPGEYIVVHLSGKDKYENGELHASFGLSSKDTVLVLSDNMSRRIDSIALPELSQNISYGIGTDGSLRYFSVPTPGSENYASSFENLSAADSIDGRLIINEVSAASVDASTGAALDDWIEIFNASDSAVNLSGYGLSNNAAERFRFKFGSVTIEPGQFLVVSCAGSGAAAGKAPFKIDCSGEQLFLTSPAGATVDAFSSGKLRIGSSSGRAADGSRLFYTAPTKGAANSESGYTSYLRTPVFSSDGGYVSQGYTVTASSPDGAAIHYTTDGSTPTTQSPVLDGPLTIDRSLTLKARAFSDSKMPSDIAFVSFLVEDEHTIPVVCISSEHKGLFSDESGIFADNHVYGDEYPFLTANFWRDWERETTVEYFVDGVKQISFTAGAKIFGQYSRTYDQKSIALHVRDIYGASDIAYPFFGSDATVFSALVLRAGGQDQARARQRDAFVTRLVKQSCDSLIAADSQPVALYINGEYYGLYNLREKINEDYLERYEGIEKQSVDIVKGTFYTTAGNRKAYAALREYISAYSMAEKQHYEYVCSQVDLESCIDYAVFMAFALNEDSANNKLYKDKTGNTKWRWILFDFDMSLRFQTTMSDFDSIDYALTNNPICAALLENDEFRQMFLERFAYHLNNTFMPENTTALWRSMTDEISGEIARNHAVWGAPSENTWSNAVDYVDKLLVKRRDMLKKQLIDYFGLRSGEVSELFPNG